MFKKQKNSVKSIVNSFGKVRALKVPENAIEPPYLSKGKDYSIIEWLTPISTLEGKGTVIIIDDNGEKIRVNLFESAHIGGHDFKQVRKL